MIAFFDGPEIPEGIKRHMIAFSCPPFVVQSGRMQLEHFVQTFERKLSPPSGLVGMYKKGKVYLHWEKAHGDAGKYDVYMRDARNNLVKCASTQTTIAIIEQIPKLRSLHFAVKSINREGKKSELSEVISLPVEERTHACVGMSLLWWLQLKIMWSSILSDID